MPWIKTTISNTKDILKWQVLLHFTRKVLSKSFKDFTRRIMFGNWWKKIEEFMWSSPVGEGMPPWGIGIQSLTRMASQEAQWKRIHLQCRRHRSDSWIKKIPSKREWQPTPVFFLPEKRNPMDRGAWWATIHGVTKSQTQLSNSTHALLLERGWVGVEMSREFHKRAANTEALGTKQHLEQSLGKSNLG